jgi:hypothetical protein
MLAIKARAAIRARCLCLIIFMSAFVTTAHAQSSYTARLTMMPIDEVNRGIVTGSGSAAATLDGKTLTVTGRFAGLRGPATIARLHQSLDRGIRGAALYDLTVTPDVEGAITGEIELTPDQVEMLVAGRLYIQIHSASAPEGNLWGWLLIS